MSIGLSDVREAASIIEGMVLRTPLVFSPTFSRMIGAEVFLKLENLQKTGSFKARGATCKILRRRREIGAGGVVAASAGNHAQGVALAARQAGLAATIVMPESASLSKQEATRNYGGEVVLKGKTLAESLSVARQLAEQGKWFVHPFDDEDIIAGQGTIALEIFEQLADPDAILVPVGGGGLIAGVALTAKALRPQTRIVGVQAAACPSAYQALRRGQVGAVEAGSSIADGILVKQIGAANYAIMRQTVDDMVLVEEEEIAAAMLMLLERKKTLAEGAGAVPLAAMLSGAVRFAQGQKVVLIISGGNVDSPLLGRIIRQGLFRNGRIMRFSVTIEDRPGALAELLDLVARNQANVLHIDHTRSGRFLPITMSRVELELETRGPSHVTEVVQLLKAGGYEVLPDPFAPLASELTGRISRSAAAGTRRRG